MPENLNYYLNIVVFLLVISVMVSLLIYILYLIFRNPFKYPYFVYKVDITSKRNVKFEDFIDRFLLCKGNWEAIQQHEWYISKWKNKIQKRLRFSLLRIYRTRQYKKVLDDDDAYRFIFIRKQTRYRQKNYKKTSYKSDVVQFEWRVSWNWLENRYKKLRSIGFETTINDYFSKSQRKLMTPALRKKIMIRDNYTCRNCGKFMPDEVGLHIDHITPIAKGGKSVPSNLCVLCSKCNGRKGAR